MKIPNVDIILLIIVAILFCSSHKSSAQSQTFPSLDNLNPVTPTAFQFVKYDQMPVSDYTGIPNISIPLYEIDEDGVKVPLDLTYHAGGIRVNEEASWTGLGWDLQVGSIVQQINDQNDLSNPTRLQPDFYNTSQLIYFPFKYEYCGSSLTCNYGCSGFIPVNSTTTASGFVVYTAQYAPFNGDYGYQDPQNYRQFFSAHWLNNLDSEPDIFSANFAGHTFKFVLDWNTNRFVVLDKQGYSITQSGNVLKVLVPGGEEYDFTLENTVQSFSSTSAISCFIGCSSQILPSSAIWMLSQIITKNKKTITFNYNKPAKPYNCYPSFSQKLQVDSATYINRITDPTQIAIQCLEGLVCSGPASLITSKVNFSSQSFSQEYYVTLSSITFPKGQVNFYTDTNRTDLLGGAKLDSIAISSSLHEFKSYHFTYSNFDASGVGGNTYTPFGTGNYGDHPLYRLKLLSLVDNGGATYSFNYNSTQLPAKNSFAIDYWGYYNGQTSNTTAIPNPIQFVNTTARINEAFLGNNLDNHSANANYAQASMLTQIKYPTGGSVVLNYELNQFNNYWVPDFANSNNSISSGDGLRIQSITWLDISGSQLKKTVYTYSGGLSIQPLSMFRTYNLTFITPGPVPYQAVNSIISSNSIMNEVNMGGFFSSNPFASINGVGYSQVVKSEIDNNNNPNGKEVNNFYNTPDMVFNSTVQALSQVDASIPAYKNPTSIDNGTPQSSLYYDNNNHLLKKVVNNYYNVTSPVYYGARFFGYGSYVTYYLDGPNVRNDQVVYPQSLIGYYPVFDYESLLSSSQETHYFGSDSLTYTTTNTYDQYNQLSNTNKSNSSGVSEGIGYTYPYNYPNTPILAMMTAQNRLSDIVTLTKGSYGGAASYLTRSYQQVGSLIVPINDAINEHTSMVTGDSTTYDQYDSSNGNLWQYSKNHLPTSLLWDYNKEYVTAEVKNALLTNIAYTSFEADGNGRWTISGTTVADTQAPTGSKAYQLSSGNISCSGLDATQTYIVSYWSKNGAQTVSGSGSVKQGYTFNGYTYFEHTVPAPAGGTVTVSGNAQIDELRLYPVTAQMTSYTYLPLVGISSESSAGGKISYYQYDSSQRLINVIDQYGNIIKHMSYHYQGQ